MRAAVLAAALPLLGSCASEPLARCERRDFTPNETEEVQKALAARIHAAEARGRETWTARKRLDPDYPSESEARAGDRRRANAVLCFQYGYYDEAEGEAEKAAAASRKFVVGLDK